MTRDELHEAIEWLDSMGTNAGYQTADFLRQIADARPEHWVVELRWADRSRGGDWKRYSEHSTAGAAHSTATRAAGPGDIEARVVPLYRLRDLGAAQHTDLAVATEAADEIERLRELLAIARDYVADELAYLRAAFRGHEELGKVPEVEADLARIDAALGATNARP